MEPYGLLVFWVCDLLSKESILSYLRNLCNGRHSRTCQRLSSSFAELCCCSCACEEAQGDPPLHLVHSGHEASSWAVRCRVGKTRENRWPRSRKADSMHCFLLFPGLKVEYGYTTQNWQVALKDPLLKNRAEPSLYPVLHNELFTSSCHLPICFFGVHIYPRWP